MGTEKVIELVSLGKPTVIHVSKAGPEFKIVYSTIQFALAFFRTGTPSFDNGKTVQQYDQSVIRRRNIVEQ